MPGAVRCDLCGRPWHHLVQTTAGSRLCLRCLSELVELFRRVKEDEYELREDKAPEA